MCGNGSRNKHIEIKFWQWVNGPTPQYIEQITKNAYSLIVDNRENAQRSNYFKKLDKIIRVTIILSRRKHQRERER